MIASTCTVLTALQLFNCGFKNFHLFYCFFGFLDIVIGLFASFHIDCAPGGTNSHGVNSNDYLLLFFLKAKHDLFYNPN